MTGQIQAILFDLDGTLVDSERLQWRAYTDVLRTFGVEVGIDEYRRHWIAVEGGPEYACRTYRLPIDAAELRVRKAERYRQLIEPGVPPCHGAREALLRLRASHRLAIATNTVRAELDHILGGLGFDTLLHATVAREDYVRPKPAPDAYLAAAAVFGLPAGACVVVEDTQRGLRAGLAAGMRVVVVPNELTRDNDFSGAAARLDSLDGLDAALLARLRTP
jgi:HAD superfamily hydrolase (TIGR01509 family)